MVFVAGPTRCVHENRCERIWWRNEALRCTDRESHVLRQNNGQEVCKRICDGRRVEEDLHTSVTDSKNTAIACSYHGESPDLDIQTTAKELLQAPWLWLCVTTILVDCIDDKLGLALVEEMPRGVGLVGEVNKCPITDDTQEDRKRSLDDEDPAPSVRR